MDIALFDFERCLSDLRKIAIDQPNKSINLSHISYYIGVEYGIRSDPMVVEWLISGAPPSAHDEANRFVYEIILTLISANLIKRTSYLNRQLNFKFNCFEILSWK